MKSLYYLTEMEIQFKNLLSLIFPFSDIKLINKKTNSIVFCNFIFTIIYNFFYFFVKRSHVIKNYLNNFANDYKISYNFNEKYYVSTSFIIKINKSDEKFNCSNIDKIIINTSNCEKKEIKGIEITKYDNNIQIRDFLINNFVELDKVENIIVDYIPIFNISKKVITKENMINMKINDFF